MIEDLTEKINEVRKSSVKKIIDQRLGEFKKIGKSNFDEIFKELCFCLLTANYNAERAIKIQKEIGANGFLNYEKCEIEKSLKKFGHRFPKARSDFICAAREKINELKKILSSDNEFEIREWLVKNIKGLGYKEASHFLRNIGFENFAIIDFHIIDVLERYGLIKRPKTLTRKKYLEIEELLRKMAIKLGMNLAELDLYLWYLETGKVLK